MRRFRPRGMPGMWVSRVRVRTLRALVLRATANAKVYQSGTCIVDCVLAAVAGGLHLANVW